MPCREPSIIGFTAVPSYRHVDWMWWIYKSASPKQGQLGKTAVHALGNESSFNNETISNQVAVTSMKCLLLSHIRNPYNGNTAKFFKHGIDRLWISWYHHPKQHLETRHQIISSMTTQKHPIQQPSFPTILAILGKATLHAFIFFFNRFTIFDLTKSVGHWVRLRIASRFLRSLARTFKTDTKLNWNQELKVDLHSLSFSVCL